MKSLASQPTRPTPHSSLLRLLTPLSFPPAAYFFAWIARHLQQPHFVPTLNFALSRRKWRNGATLREVLGGRDIDDLWDEYNAHLQVKGLGTRTGPAVALPTHGTRA